MSDIVQDNPVKISFFQKIKKYIGIIALLLIIIAIPLTVIFSRYTQETRQRASGVTPTPVHPQLIENLPAKVCGSSPADIMLIIDRSDSMKNNNKIQDAQAAAKSFVDYISTQSANTRIGLISFAPTASVDVPFTQNFSSVKTAIDNLKLSYGTCTVCAVNKLNQELASDTSSNKKAAVLLTDGRANWLDDPKEKTVVPTATAELATLTSINQGPAIPYFTIGLGPDVLQGFLQNIANTTGGVYFFAPTGSQLQDIYSSISTIIGKGLISGFVFNDKNHNQKFDSGEPPLSGWTVELRSNTQQTLFQSTTSDITGGYTFTNLCDGTYSINEILQSGWNATIPINPAYYTISINGGSSNPNKNFGNILPAPTPTNTPPPVPSKTPTPTPQPTITPPVPSISPTPPVCSPSQAICQWDPAANATSYTGLVTDTTDGSSTPFTVDASQTFFSFASKPNHSYTCAVNGANVCGSGAPGTKTFTCTPPPSPTPTSCPPPQTPPNIKITCPNCVQ